jgi:hypothetical protein
MDQLQQQPACLQAGRQAVAAVVAAAAAAAVAAVEEA